MVYFSCSACNESLKKNKVANHLSFCRRCSALTCLDCQQDFTTQTYSSHNNCMTEVEKYGGPGYQLPANANKGQKRQMGWMESVRANVKRFIDETKNQKNRKDEQILLTGLLQYDNIPRKKAKFVNFVKSSFGRFRYNDSLIDRAWEVVSAVSVAEPEPKPVEKPERNGDAACAETTEDVDEEKAKKKKKKKKKREEEEDAAENGVEEEIRHKKKSKKRKHEEEDEENEEPMDESPSNDEENQKKKKKKKKRKRTDEEEGEEEEEEMPTKKRKKVDYAPEGFEQTRLNDTLEVGTPKKFVIGEAVTDILTGKGDAGISMKKLEKRILSQYLATLPEGRPAREHKISSKLKTVLAKQFRVVNDRVFLRPDV